MKANRLLPCLLLLALLSTPVLAAQEDFRVPDPFANIKGAVCANFFTREWYASTRERVNFWVKNIGETPVTMDIDGQNAQTVPPGREATLQVETSLLYRTFLCRVLPAPGEDQVCVQYAFRFYPLD